MEPFPPTQRAVAFSRRTFIGAALAGLAAPMRGVAADAGAAMLGFNTYGMKTMTTEEALPELAKIGFDSIQLDCSVKCDADPGNLSAARRGAIRKIAGDLGLKLTAIQGMPNPTTDDGQHAAGLERLKLLAQLAHDLDSTRPPSINATLGGSAPWEQAKEVFARRLADWVKVAESSGIAMAIKPHRGTSMDRPEYAIELIQALGTPPCLRMNFDYSHFALRDMPMAEAIRVALPWTSFVAMKDVAMEDGRAVFKLPGETKQIDYAALIRQFHEGGYRGDYGCEISAMIFTKPGFDYLAAARTSYANLAPSFVAAGVGRVKRP